MIQIGTHVIVSDNSGARKAMCIGLYNGFQSSFAGVGDTILVTVKRLRSKRRNLSKAKKGSIYKALIIRVKVIYKNYNSSYSFNENSIVLLNQKNKLLGTRIFGALPKKLRYTKFSKLITLSLGLLN